MCERVCERVCEKASEKASERVCEKARAVEELERQCSDPHY